MSQTSTPILNNRRKRLLSLVKKYYTATHARGTLSNEDQIELEQLVTSELRMPLSRARVILEQLARQSENEEATIEGNETLEESVDEKE